MKVTAKVFKNGNSWAVRLPAMLKVKAKELCVSTNRDGDIILYDEKMRERAFKKRLQALEQIMANPVLEKDEEL